MQVSTAYQGKAAVVRVSGGQSWSVYPRLSVSLDVAERER